MIFHHGDRFSIFDIHNLYLQTDLLRPNLITSNSPKSLKSSFKNIFYSITFVTVGYSSKSANFSIAYPRLAFLPTSSSKCASMQWGNYLLPPLLDCSTIYGAPSSSSSLSTIPVYNTSVISISTTCAMSSSHTIPSPKIGKAPNMTASILNGITSEKCDTSSLMYTSRES